MASVATIAPVLRYRDLDAAVAWLRTAFGMEPQHTVADAGGVLEYAELRWGSALFLLSKVADSDLDALMAQPDEVGGAATQTCYLVVEDADAHCARASGVGAQIVLGVRDDAFGGRSYACRDPEGHVWNFGTHAPRASAAPEPVPMHEPVREAGPSRRPRLLLGLLSFITAASLVFAAWAHRRAGDVTGATERVQAVVLDSAAEIGVVRARLEEEQKLRGEAEQALQAANSILSAERKAKAAVEGKAGSLANQLELARAAKEKAERDAGETRAVAERESRTRIAAEQVVEDLRAQLEREVAARQAVEAARAQSAREEDKAQALEASRAELAREAGARKAAESKIGQLQAELDEARRTRDVLAQSATRDRELLAREQEARRIAGEQLAQEQIAREKAQTTLKELESRSGEHRSASVEVGTVSEPGQSTSPAAKEHATPRRKVDAGVDLLALYNFVAKARGTPQAERARSRLRNLVSTTRDSAQLSRFINTVGQGPFVDLAKRRVQTLGGGRLAKPQQEDEVQPPAVVLEQRELLDGHKTYATTP